MQLIFESVSVEIALIITNFSVQNLDSQQCNMGDKHVSRAPKDRGQTIKAAFKSDKKNLLERSHMPLFAKLVT